MNLKAIGKKIEDTLLIAGGINWGIFGLTGLFNMPFNLINFLTKWLPMWVENAIYVAVGVAGVTCIIRWYNKK